MIYSWRRRSNRAIGAGFRSWESALRTAKKSRVEARHRPWPLSQRPGFLIRRLHQIHVALFQEACGEFEITPLQYSLLSALAVRKTADQTTLAADIALDRTTTTGALKRLAARNFVERAINDEDRRARLCKLTPAGTTLLAKIEASARAAHRATLDNLSEREQVAFVEMMQRIVAAHSDHDSASAIFD
ncbi:MarR family transcriptional regulator [Bradyrhizobium sp. AUGA SZCCT0176]|nr:MarR family transcriptional regulator [Bradyrhizobium sp. AUGA SZCCT0176]MBR1296051.1 MarR family transcriptional regulator [Bradyrhizobium sp. AUGA SZCCT0042]